MIGWLFKESTSAGGCVYTPTVTGGEEIVGSAVAGTFISGDNAQVGGLTKEGADGC